MTSITFALDHELRSEIQNLRWVNWSELIREKLIKRIKQAEFLISKLNSPEEQELIKWSVELGRKAKKGSFRRLLSEVSPKKRKELLNAMSPDKRKEYE